MIFQQRLNFSTNGRDLVNITTDVAAVVKQANVEAGICHIFLHHTSASLILCENADPDVLKDLEAFMQRVAPDDSNLYKHTAEGPDDMPSHIRTVITQNSLSIPIEKHKLSLGTWQGIFLWEHRVAGHDRDVTVTIQS